MNPQYGTAVKNANMAPSMGVSPIANTPQIQHIQNLAAVGFRSDAVNRAMGGFMGAATQKVNDDEAARTAANAAAQRDAALKARKEKLAAELNNPDNFVRAVSADGGYDFYDPTGNKITAQQYSQVTGKQIDKVLEGSGSRQDLEFKADYARLKEYGKALAGDSDAMQKFKEKNDAWLNSSDNKGLTYAEVVNGFRNYYSNYFQPAQGVDVGDTQVAMKNANKTLSHAEPTTGQPLVGGIADWLHRNRRAGVEYK